MFRNYFIYLLFLVINVATAQDLAPYLQAVTPTSIYVNWKTEGNNESVVEYGTTASNLNVTVTGNTNIFVDSGYPGNYYYHSVKLVNLTPNTRYFYRTKTGNSYSEIASFKTLPNPGEAATSDGHIRFLIMGDNQLRNVPRYDSLVSAAKRKIIEKYGGSPEESIAMTFMVGDQVDVGTLDHYENVHFIKNRELSKHLAIQTTVGNHETYGTLGMSAYYDHFYLDDFSYQGISSGTENYYAYQAGNVLFLSLSSEHTGAQQASWLQAVINAAEDDNTVDWIFSLSHRPYQAEQYVGDISPWVRNTAVPMLSTTDKYILHIGAHHHLYHRGQLKDDAVYNIISGGTAWDQYWGMSTEEDFEDVQKTISNWMYQIVDIDVENGKMDVESYSIGSIIKWKNNQLMDEFHHYKDKAAPEQPEITNVFTTNVTLPIELEGTPFSTTTDELLNTTQFLIAKDQDFNIVEKDVYRDYENLYGMYQQQKDSTVDINLGIDITKLLIDQDEIPNGTYYVKTRYRDRNLMWSSWSEVKDFTVEGSTYTNTEISINKEAYDLNEAIEVSYADAPENTSTWIGLYDEDQTPGSGSPSIVWNYTDGLPSGTITFPNGISEKGRFYAAIFENGGYTEIADRKYFYVGPEPVLNSNQTEYQVGDPIEISFTNGPELTNDWIGIYKMGQTPGDINATAWDYVSGASQTLTFSELTKGYYYAQYFIEDSYNAVGNTVFFKVGELVTELWINESVYELGEEIITSWTDAPGIIKDWLGIYYEGADPNIDPLYSYTYFDGLAEGTKTIEGDALPNEEGNYFIVMFTNDSYDEVSNRVNFEVIDPLLTNEEYSVDQGLVMYPNPTNNADKTIIKSDYPIEKIEIFNTTGKLMYATENVNNERYSFITQDLPTGVYIVKIHSRKLHTAKLIVK
ncbi:fibronectin type III domain-containing protein [Aequorivita sp. Q41]|uniref:fibronectin type III domain-containing protein n=1 Tax=Aequorivita sp. Q41 TaxID=3153300 RepID=UPI003242C110